MTTPYRGRGRGRGFGRGIGSGRGGNNMLPYQESNISLIGDWTTVGKLRQLPAPPKKEDQPSSSSKKIISYKDIIVNESKEQASEYFENPVTEKIIHIDEEDLSLTRNDGWSIKTRYLESRGYAGLFGKSRPNLEILLTVTESVTITHYYQNNNPESFINFSKCHINKILLPREWGLNPNGEKAIKIAEDKYIYFNYWDYIQAFTQAFYYQNPKNKHSWFFSINPEIVDKPIPNWFFNWWIKFGPSLEILPKEVGELYTPWCENSSLISKIASNKLITGQCPCLFFIKFQIPWIWRWTVTISKDIFNIPILERNFFYKWWTKKSSEDIQDLISRVKIVINEDKATGTKDHSHQYSMADLKDYFQRKYPKESEEEVMVRILDHMKTQFFNTFPSTVKGDDMSTSSQGSVGQNMFEGLAGESQPDDEPTQEDFWDAMIQSIKTKKDKS
ncbi:uncharacterized protein LOC123896070 [Trifolium pratense]|uniref:uncharacterized protein LOC123896070 n=1 Tax=Trifolium pratense TaxID=57577 RepID=UPI001E68FF7F|nr:uncharacterized protein LOC123896070 [Trifolium pratense]